MRIRLFYLLLFLFLGGYTQAQNVIEELNGIREELGLPHLQNHIALQQSAEEQGVYEVAVKKITSINSNKKHRTTADRVKFYGGDFRNVKEHSYLISATDSLNEILKNHYFRQAILNKFYDQVGIARYKSWRKGRDLVVLVIAKTPVEMPLFDEYKSDLSLKTVNGLSYEKAMDYMARFKQKPGEVRYDVKLSGGDSLFFVMNDVDWFNVLFGRKKDGIAVDMMVSRQFSCGEPNLTEARGMMRGYALGKWDAAYLLKNAVVNKFGRVKCFLQRLPPGMSVLDKEFNLLLIQEGRVVQYTEFYNVEYSDWKLLDMPLRRVSMPTSENLDSLFIDRHLQFEIPFEKDKSEYSKADIEPLYDSLKLNRYNIKRAQIRAYASVEGGTKHNIALQQARAESIVKILEELHLDEIPTSVNASENWVEFYRDIKESEQAELASKDKEEIKYLLNNKGLSVKLEELLAPHRKAIINLELTPKFQKERSFAELKKTFDQALKKHDIEEALYLQQALFHLLGNDMISDQSSVQLTVPEEEEYVLLNHNQVVFHGPDSSNIDELITRVTNHIGMQPNATEMKYNLCVLLLWKWKFQQHYPDAAFLYRSIQYLERQPGFKTLARVLKVNFYILDTREKMKIRDYVHKNDNLQKVKRIYDGSTLSQEEVLRIARFFVFYLKEQWAVQLLTPWAYRLDVSEDLLFYYLNLTILNDSFTAKLAYKRVMLNAINLNKERFCLMFRNAAKQGVTFQLLEDQSLKAIYCAECVAD